MAEINQLPIQESEPYLDSDNRILSLLETSKNISQFSTTLIGNNSAPSSEVEFGYYAQLSESVDVNEFKQKIDKFIRALGFDEFSYFRTSGVGQDPQKLISICSTMVNEYYTEKLYEKDLILTYANKNTKPIFQTVLYEYAAQSPVDTETSRGMKALCKLNNSYGYYDFFNSFASARNGNGNVMLSVTNRGCNPLELRKLVAKSRSTEVIANSMGQLFAACAKRSGNSEILLRVENASDRLNYIRICEARMQTTPLVPLLKIIQHGSKGDYEHLRSSLNTQFELSLKMLPHVMRQGIFPVVSMTDEVVVERVAEKPQSNWR